MSEMEIFEYLDPFRFSFSIIMKNMVFLANPSIAFCS